jgi:hypothetical protein
MSARNGFVLLVALSALMFLAACGNGSSGTSVGTAPPSGAFSKSNLNGTYVFSVSGTDGNDVPYAMAGVVTANGSGGITGGAVDINDLETTSVPNAPVNNNSAYSVGADGRGTITLGVPGNPFSGNNISLDFVLQDNSHGLIVGFDGNYSGSGTIDLQASSPTPTGTYAFSLSGADVSGSSAIPFATVGNFTLSGTSVTSGLEDFNVNGSIYADQAVTAGALALGPSSTPATSLTTAAPLGTLTFDAIAIDANHLKLIEMDTVGNLVGDAYSQTSATISNGNLAFTLAGFTSGEVPFAAGGIMIASGGTINTSIEDYNSNGTTVSAFNAPTAFSGTYGPVNTDPANSGRNVINLASFFGGQSELAAYPSSGGTLLLEIDSAGLVQGAAYSQSSTSFAASEGYGLNLSGVNTSETVEELIGVSEAEVDDIAEFTADSSGTTVSGVIDENFAPENTPNAGLTLTGTYASPGSDGRGQISATAGNSANSTLNGGFDLTFYTVDGTTFPFIESDADGQTATGVFVEQSSSASGSAAKPVAAKAHSLFVAHPLTRPRALKSKVK